MSSALLTLARAPDAFGFLRRPGECLLLPSSLDLNDPYLKEVLAVRTLTKARIPSRSGRFRRVELPGSGTSVRLDRDVAEAQCIFAVINLDLVGSTGPFALDLIARYLPPIDRAKLLISSNKLDTIARLNQVRPIESFLIAKSTGDGSIWVETGDPIAAELAALALSENTLPANRAHRSPWEDELVQRATELELGARYPGDIRLEILANNADPDVIEAVAALHLRIGIDI